VKDNAETQRFAEKIMTSVTHGEGLGKRYRRGVRVDTGLRHVLDRFVRDPLAVLRRPSYETFWALKDVSLEVKEGEVLGLIGRNGAGKTTLLKVLSRITRPTEGWAEIRGSVRSLLEVGDGIPSGVDGSGEHVFVRGDSRDVEARDCAEAASASRRLPNNDYRALVLAARNLQAAFPTHGCHALACLIRITTRFEGRDAMN
jgi:hypothetical protein